MKDVSNYNSVIAFLRLPLTLLVVFIHVPYTSMGGDVDYIHEFWIDGICSIAVPAFFFISGYLFCPVKFSWQVYGEKLKRRINTLLIPYIAWNLIALLVLIIPYYHDFNYSVANVLAVFVDCKYSFLHATSSSPIDYPLWYIRDLIVCCVLSPMFYAAGKLKGLIPAISLILWICEISLPIGGISAIAICFFTLGGCVRIYGLPFKNRPNSWLISIVLILCIYLATGLNLVFHCAVMPVIVLSLFPLGKWILAKSKWDKFSKYGNFAFVLYASHAIFIKKIWNQFMAIGLHQSVVYWATYILMIVVGIMLYYFIQRNVTISSILIGKRINQDVPK